MKRLVFTALEEYRYDEVPDLRIQGDKDVLVEITHIGICGTDLHIYKGSRKVNFPLVAGHEAIGIVKAIGKGVTKHKVGDRVVLDPNWVCGSCEFCQSGHKNLCQSKILKGVDVDGVFQTQVVSEEKQFWPIPHDMSPQAGIAIEVATVALAAVNKANIKLGDHVFIAGAGIVGLFALQFAKLAGADVTVMDLSEDRLAIAERLGAKVCDGKGELPSNVDIAIDCAGVEPTINTCLKVVKNAGLVVNIGLGGKPASLDMMNITRRELTICGSVACTTEFPTVIKLFSEGRVDVDAVVTHTVSFDQTVEGIRMMLSQEAIKVAVEV